MIRRLFTRSKPPRDLPEAELARRLTDPDFVLDLGEYQLRPGVGVICPEAPFSWKNPPAPQPDAVFDAGGPEIFTENYARRDGDNLLRAYLPIPVQGTQGQVFIGIWCSLKTGFHARFRSAQARGDADQLGEMFSWLYTQLPRFTGPVMTKGTLVPYAEGRTPLYWITDEKHPFFAHQHDGMNATAILELYEAFGHGDVVDMIKA